MKYSDKNPPLVCMQTQSTCYKGTTTMVIKGVLWHSTGVQNTTLKRYVQPSDKKPSADTYSKAKWLELLGKNKYNNDWNHLDLQSGLNCWIGTLADGTVTTVQTMPWNYKPWGCGEDDKGSCNNGWIQFEICEDYLKDATYFNKVYKEACEITAYLCKKYNIDPKATVKHCGVNVPTILCHADAYNLGLGSDHADVLHWFPKFGKDMDDVRNDVAALIKEATPPPPPEEPEPEPDPASNIPVLNVAMAEIGYYTTGNGNTGTLKSKYAKYFDDNHYYGAHDSRNYYNLKKNGYHWCSMFVDWCFVHAYGEQVARRLTYHKDTNLAGAGCEFSARAYYKNNRFFTSNPQPGDEIFFDWGGGGKAKSLSDCDRADHTGLVYSVSGDKITTIEGNTSDDKGHSSAVAFKTRYVSSSTTMGFGRPIWDSIEDPEIQPPDPEEPDIPPINPDPDPDPDVPPEEPELPDPPIVSALNINRIFTEHAIVEVCVSGDEISNLYYSLNGMTTRLAVESGFIAFKIEDLVPNTNYSITVVAENPGGYDSATASFKTLQDYPSPIQGIALKSTASTNKETDLFSAIVDPPERWGYWKDKAGHDYGYRLFLVSNCRLLAYKDVTADSVHELIPVSSFDAAVKHEDNLQVGIITWVIDNTNSKIFDTKDAGTLYPVCSNSICLKELSEMSDILYFSDSGAQRRTQPYMDGQPVKIFKI